MKTPITFYTNPLSGHAHRVELMLRALDLDYVPVTVDLRSKAQKADSFVAMNPFGQVPVIDDNGTIVWDSTAILTYLGLGYDPEGRFLPRDAQGMAQTIGWLGKASGPVAYGLAAARRINLFNTPQDLAQAQAAGLDFLKVLDESLKNRDWLVGDGIGVADMTLYAYVAHAPEGGIDIVPFTHVGGWLARIEAQPFFVPMARNAVGLWAAEVSAAG